MAEPTLTSPGRARAHGRRLQLGELRPCAGRCDLFVPGTRDSVRGPVYCPCCDGCRPGPWCGRDVCQGAYPLPVPDEEQVF
jgi:hypothetical protein